MATKQKWQCRAWRAVLTALLGMAVFFACGAGETEPSSPQKSLQTEDAAYTGEIGAFEGLSAETELRILRDYYDTYIRREPALSSVTINDLRISDYFGAYHGYVVVTIEDGLPFRLPAVLPRPYQIKGIVFPWLWPSHPFPTVWNNGKFYEIVALYDSGLLTRDDLESIAGHGHPKDRD